MDKLPPGITQADVEGFMQLTQANQPSAPVANQAKLPPGITQADVEGFMQLSQANQPVAPAPVQTPVAPRIVGPVDTSMNRRESLNNQSAGINYTQDDIDLQMYNGLMNAAKNGATAQADYWNQFSPNQKARVGKLVAGAYAQAPEHQKGILSNIITALGNSSRNTLDSFGRVKEAIKSTITGDDSYINNKNLEISRDRANREIEDAADPSVVRDVAEVGGDIAQFAAGSAALKGVGAVSSVALSKIPGGSKIISGITDLAATNPNTAKAVKYALEGAVANTAQNPGSGDSVLMDKLEQAGIGAAFGSGAGLLGEKAANYVGTKINKVKEARNTPLSAEDLAFKENAEKAGLNTLLANDYPGASQELKASGKNLTTHNEQVRSTVQKQQKELNESVANIKTMAKDPEINNIAKETGLDDISNTSPHYDDALNIKKKLSSVDSEDFDSIVQLSAQSKLLSSLDKSSQKYKVVEDLIPQNSGLNINFGKQALIDAEKELRKSTNSMSKEKLAPAVKTIKESINDNLENGKLSYPVSNQIIRDIGSVTDDLRQAGNREAVRILNNFRNAIEKDQDAFINSLPAGDGARAYKAAYEDAKAFNRENVQKIRNNDNINDIFNIRDNTNKEIKADKLISSVIRRGETDRAKELYDFLPQSGQDAIKKNQLNKFVRESFDKDGNVITTQLKNSYKSLEDKTTLRNTLDVILTKQEKAVLDNLVNTASKLQNLSNAKGLPLTGVQNNAILKSMDTVFRATATIANPKTWFLMGKPIIAFIKSEALAKGLTDPKLHRLTINLNNLNPSRPAYAEKVAEISAYLSAKLGEEINK